MINTNFLHIHPEVQHALSHNIPVVALEFTIISHGMPWTQNAATAKAVENVVRQYGAVPATIAIKDARCLVGLVQEDIEFFGQTQGVWKVSLTELPIAITHLN